MLSLWPPAFDIEVAFARGAWCSWLTDGGPGSWPWSPIAVEVAADAGAAGVAVADSTKTTGKPWTWPLHRQSLHHVARRNSAASAVVLPCCYSHRSYTWTLTGRMVRVCFVLCGQVQWALNELLSVVTGALSETTRGYPQIGQPDFGMVYGGSVEEEELIRRFLSEIKIVTPNYPTELSLHLPLIVPINTASS